MRLFSKLYARLDRTRSLNKKVAALVRYLEDALPEDAAWAVYFLMGRRIKTRVKNSELRSWAAEAAGIPLWLLEECYDAAGDLAETLAAVIPKSSPAPQDPRPLHEWVEEVLMGFSTQPSSSARHQVTEAWSRLDLQGRFLFNKLLTGGFRVGVSQKTVTRALAQVSGLEPAVLAHRLMGGWQPSKATFEDLLAPGGERPPQQPYPFFLASPLKEGPEDLGDPGQWQVEWKWDGIRAQLIRRGDEVFLWSRGEEIITHQFPGVASGAHSLQNGVVLDGELLAYRHGEERQQSLLKGLEGSMEGKDAKQDGEKDAKQDAGLETPSPGVGRGRCGPGEVLPFSVLQRRLQRKRVGKKLLGEAPVVFMAFDLLELGGEDCRGWPLRERRRELEGVLGEGATPLLLSPLLEEPSWEAYAMRRRESRIRRVEGLMIKSKGAPYGLGRKRGAWWKWKVDPYAIDAVLLYAQKGHGRRAGLFTDYTLAVWDETGEGLIPFAKAYSGLSDEEIREVDRFVKKNTLDRFGPVRAVQPGLVMEVHFDGIRRSTRHKSGLAVRFPRIARWRRDKLPKQADSLESLRRLLP